MKAWVEQLDRGDLDGAWDGFLSLYRPLILATIRRVVGDPDDVMDVFSDVCAAFSAGDSARLRTGAAIVRDGNDLAPWIVTVVRRAAIDWRRREEGRPRLTIPDGLSQLHRRIYQLRCIEHHALVETFELLTARGHIEMRYAAFLREVRSLNLRAPCGDHPVARTRESLSDSVADDTAGREPDVDTPPQLEAALAELPDDLRLAISLFVVDGLPAAQVASAVGWSGAKAVYNRVGRALLALRERLRREGISPTDLSE